jgi:uncharacterized protein with PIN domain
MAENRCDLCNEEISKGFLEKDLGTTIKLKKDERTILRKVCKNCQKKYKDNIKKELEKSL